METTPVNPAPDIAGQWKGLSLDERTEALSRMSDDQKQKLAETLGFNALTPNHPTNTTIGAAPSPLSLHGIGDKLYTARDWVVNNLPQVGGLAGGLLGTLGGVETGPGAVVAGTAGATAGGGLGEDLKQFLNEKFHPEDAKMTPVQAAVGIGKQALSQGAQELAGQVAGRVMGTVARKFTPPDQILQRYPFLKTLTAVGEDTNPKAAQHLTAAATANDVVGRSRNAGTALQAINNTMGDLEGEMTKLPPEKRTVEGFLGAVNNRKNAMNTESGAAMMAPVTVPASTAPAGGLGAAAAKTAKSSPYEDFLNRVATKNAREAAGQGVLDDMVEKGISPSDVSKQFWEKTYYNLPEGGQQAFQRYLSKIWGGAKPGDVIGTAADGSPLIAKDWADLAKYADIGSNAEHLEGTERGYVALMREANQRFTSKVAPPAGKVAQSVAGVLPGATAPTTKQVPLASVQTVPIGISDSIKNLIKSYMTQTQAGLTDRKYLLRRAAEFEKPWTYGQLDQLRSDLSAQLAKHNAQNPVARYTAQKGDLDLAIDNAVLDGLRDTVYPQMDQAAGKAPGYFADLKGRQSSLIQLQELLDKRIKDLKGSQALKDVTPPLSTENISISGHPGSVPRFGFYGLREALFPQSTMSEANKHVAAAFPNVNSMPYRALFSGAAHIAGIQAPPKSKKTQQIGEQLESPDKWYNQKP